MLVADAEFIMNLNTDKQKESYQQRKQMKIDDGVKHPEKEIGDQGIRFNISEENNVNKLNKTETILDQQFRGN